MRVFIRNWKRGTRVMVKHRALRVGCSKQVNGKWVSRIGRTTGKTMKYRGRAYYAVRFGGNGFTHYFTAKQLEKV